MCLVYADDDELVRQAVSGVLIDAGYDVHACCGGREAISLCDEFRPPLVLLDLNMPELDGLETARRLRQRPGMLQARLVAFTGRGTAALRESALDAGFDEFLIKPAEQAVLIRALGGRAA